jgi:hypothetical protein
MRKQRTFFIIEMALGGAIGKRFKKIILRLNKFHSEILKTRDKYALVTVV